MKESLAKKFTNEEAVDVTNKASILGTDYAVGMLLPLGITGGLPDFAEIIQIVIMHDAHTL